MNADGFTSGEADGTVTVDEYYASRTETARHAGTESEWLLLGEFSTQSGMIQVTDAQLAPEFGVNLEVPAGPYRVLVKVVDYGDDTRFSRIRALSVGSEISSGKEIGEMFTDSAQAGLFDPETYPPEFAENFDKWLEFMEPQLTAGSYGVAVLNQESRALMPFVNSGFGDGTYRVYELLSGDKTVGLEVLFLNPNGSDADVYEGEG